jgi:outer membrane receptor protein involved in Fe transport
MVTNLNLNERADGFPNVTIRGVGSFGNTQGVGFYLDDVQLFYEAADRYGDMERIEVLKGPQGTLYGGSNIGGAVKYVSRRPNPERFEGYLEAEAGEQNTRGFEGALNIPLSESWAVRIFAFWAENDGFLENHGGLTVSGLNPDTRRHVDRQEEYGGRIQLQGNITDRLSAYLTYRYNDLDGGNNDYVLDLDDDHLSFSDDRNLTIDPRHLRETSAFTAQFDLELDAVILTSLSSYTDTDYDQTSDPDFSRDYALEVFGSHENEVFTQEVRATSNTTGRFEWTIGAYYLHQDNPIHLGLKVYPLMGVNLGFFDLPTVLFLISEGILPEDTILATPPFVDSEIEREDLSGFVSGSYRFGNFEFGAGLRVDNWKVDRLYTPTGGTGSWDETEVLPRLSATYFLDEDRSMVYGIWAKGFEPGGFNETNFTGSSALFGFDREQLSSFEVGYKGRLMDDRLHLTVAGFMSEYKDKQVELATNDPGNPGGFVEGILNAGDSDQWGGEIELSWLVNDYVTLNFGAGFVDSEWVDDTIVNISGTEFDISGNTPEEIREKSVNFIADYEYPHAFADYSFWARFSTSYRSSFWGNLQNTAKNPSYTVMGLGLGVRNERWEFAVSVKNLSDEEYYTDFTSFSAFNPLTCDGYGLAPNCELVAASLGQPRLIVGSVRYNF